MYQLEIKHYLVAQYFSPKEGWSVIVDIDAMEQAKGSQQKPDKKGRVEKAESALRQLGVKIGASPKYGRVDVMASHPDYGIFLVEVEGKSSKQKEQSLYSALGQALLIMNYNDANITYGVAVPDLPEWEEQIMKIPQRVKEILRLKCFLVSENNIREV